MLGFPLGILSAAGAGGVVPVGPTYELISTTILGTATSSVSFSSLATYASDYKHLQIRIAVRTDTVNDLISMRLNSDTGANYANHELQGDGSTVNSSAAQSQTSMRFGRTAYSTMTANSFAGMVVDLLDTYSTSKNKTIRCLSGRTGAANSIQLFSGFHMSTASLTSITILPGSPNFIAGSRFSLYGIR
jgi:hypothetical protein